MSQYQPQLLSKQRRKRDQIWPVALGNAGPLRLPRHTLPLALTVVLQLHSGWRLDASARSIIQEVGLHQSDRSNDAKIDGHPIGMVRGLIASPAIGRRIRVP